MIGGRPELDIVVWMVAGRDAAESSGRAHAIFANAALRDLHLALVQLPRNWFESNGRMEAGQDSMVTCLRSVLMKPEHEGWIDAIWEKLLASCASLKGA